MPPEKAGSAGTGRMSAVFSMNAGRQYPASPRRGQGRCLSGFSEHFLAIPGLGGVHVSQNAGTLVSWAGEWNPGSGFRNEHDGFCFGAARYSLHGQRAFPWRQGDAAGRVFGKFGPAARSRKGEFLQVAVYGITYLEKGGGRRGYGVIRRYRVRASLFRLNVPADGTEVRQNIEFFRGPWPVRGK